MSNNPILETFDVAQIEKITDLFATAFPRSHHSRNPKYLRWLLADNPAGHAKVIFIEKHESWVAFMAMIPVRLRVGARKALGYYVVDVLVHPEYQGNHLFSRMITTAKEYCASTAADLIGHPNSLAKPFWRRARMKFRDSLRPMVAVPSILKRDFRTRYADLSTVPEPFGSAVNAGASLEREVRVDADGDYVRWRYLSHPINHYLIQVLSQNQRPVGIQILKSVRPGVKILMDQFLASEKKESALKVLPPVTICFVPESAAESFRPRLQPLPTTRRLPYFLTPGDSTVSQSEALLGLSASDF